MKTIITGIGLATLVAGFLVSAQVTQTEETTEVRENPDGTTTETTTTTTTTFTPAARTKVVEFFESYSSNPHGLPPAWVERIEVKEIPSAWRTRIQPGVVIEQEHRTHLIPAPAELIKVLPPAPEQVTYYVAGGNVVAVDESYKVVDAIQIPSVKIEVE